MLQVPAQYNRNSATVSSLMPAEDSGLWLLRRMQEQLGIASLAGRAVLDFGCGVRFTQTILAHDVAIGRYVGVDCYREMIRYLQSQVLDPRLTYCFLDARHALYNPEGQALDAARLPLPEGYFDIACMFSVITHQHPTDAAAIFRLLRRHVRHDGLLFFTCFLDDRVEGFEDRSPERNGGRCVYRPAMLEEILSAADWTVTDRAAAEAPLIGDSYVCRPAEDAPPAPPAPTARTAQLAGTAG